MLVRMITLAIAKTFSKLFGLATITFFGRAPTRDDDKLGAIGLLSVTWPFMVVSMILPDAAEMFIPFAPDDDTALRAIAGALVLGIPAVVGGLVHSVQNQPDGKVNAARNVALGYMYTPVVGFLVIALVLVVPIVKISYLARRYELQHLAVMVPEDGYDRLREHIQEILDGDGIGTSLHEHEWVVRQLFAALSWTEGRIFRRGMATRMQRLVGYADGRRFELTIHATDLSIIGEHEAVSSVFGLLAERLDPRVAYLSWDDASQQVEDEIARCRDEIDAGDACDRKRLEDLARDLRQMALSPPEWNAIRHRLYRVEIDSERLRADAARETSAPEPSA